MNKTSAINTTLTMAKTELDKYIALMTGSDYHDIELIVKPDSFAVDDPDMDDSYRISVHEGAGQITASNPRALLIAVYHLLRKCGCGFVRPSTAGERIPRKTLSKITADITINASHRYRGICIEGAVDLDGVLRILDWMPKVGMNTYFMQFREGYNFFERYYTRYKSIAGFNLSICRSLIDSIVQAAHERGLMYQGVGHGFTCECYGVHGLGWQEMPDAWPEEFRHVIALKNGKRDVVADIPLITALCYSDKDIQKTVVDGAADYIALHPELDAVHFWLDDGNNNKCECKKCRDTYIADFYIPMLNALDEQLTERGIKTKIILLAYHELLWPPRHEMLRNSDRFVFMFAPIQRSFLEPLGKAESAGAMKEYTLNHQPFPRNNYEMLTHLKAWNEYLDKAGLSPLESFDFDYYFSRYNDPGQFAAARIAYEDIRNLRANRLNGIVNCQSQRLFDHAALPMYVMAMTLLDKEQSFDEIVDDYFNAAFGQYHEVFKQYQLTLTDSTSGYRTGSRDVKPDFDALRRAVKIPVPEVEFGDLCTARSVALLQFTNQLYSLMADVREKRSLKQDSSAEREALRAYVEKHELLFDVEFDYHYIEDLLRE